MTADRGRSTPLPDYEVDQYFPGRIGGASPDVDALRAHYGPVRTYFKLRAERYRDLQRWLNQSRAGVTYDVYLTETVRYALVAGLVGALVGAGSTLALALVGGLPDVRYTAGVETWRGVRDPLANTAVGDALGGFLAANEALVASVVAAVVLGALTAVAVAAYRYYVPRTRADVRGRSIDVTLPHALVYMYALSYGGTNVVEIVRSLAASPDYGAVSEEFDAVARDMDVFGNDLFTALRNARNLTPSTNMEQFLDDLVSMLDSGGDVTRFLDREADDYLQEAGDSQTEFVETLAMLSEVFVAAFVAAPLLLVVTLMVISFMGGEVMTALYAVNYLVFPLGMVAFLLLIDLLSGPYAETTDPEGASALDDLLATDGGVAAGVAGSDADPRFVAYRRRQTADRLVALLSDPLALFRRQPTLTLVVTVPVAAAVVVATLATGVVEASATALFAAPFRTTLALFVVPFAVVAVPLSVFHERRAARRRSVAERFPDALNVLSSANGMGIPLTDGLALVARWSSGPLAVELRALHNDVAWNHDVEGALVAFGDRLRVPQLRRVVRLIARSGRSSGDLARVLSVAAEDTRNRFKLERARRRALSSYVAIVVIGYLVYLFVIVLLSTAYLAPMEALATPATDGGAGLPIALGTVPIEAYRVVFLHSALIQGVGSGLLAGRLADDSVLAGVKYSIALVALAVGAFLLV